MDTIKLSAHTIDNQDIDSLIQWLQQYPNLTQGLLVKEFEQKFAAWLGCQHAVFVNSGSSANLLSLYALHLAKRLQNNKIVVPTLSWATDLAPVMQLGFEPLLCDCNLNDLSVDLDHLERLFREYSPSALFFVPILGLVPEMDRVVQLCDDYNVVLIEDTCEALGSAYHSKKLGLFGLVSTFSFYFGHHISTIEGGMVCTDDEELADILRSARSHGWARDMSEERKRILQKQWEVDDFSQLYTFYYPGFNVRATDLQAYLGIHQLNKIDWIVEQRNKNYQFYRDRITNDFWMPAAYHDRFVSNFAFPIIHPNRDSIVAELKQNAVEVRPLLCGSLGTQPFYVKTYGEKHFPHATHVDKCGLYLPNHPYLTRKDLERIVDCVNWSTSIPRKYITESGKERA